MQKRGQFFLIAGLILVAIFAGFAAIYEKSRSPQEDVRIITLASEMKSELAYLTDYSLINNKNLTILMENATQLYVNANPDKDIAVIYGTNATITIIHYKRGVRVFSEDAVDLPLPATGQAKLTLERGNFTYPLQLNPSYQTFVFVKKERSNEQFISFK